MPIKEQAFRNLDQGQSLAKPYLDVIYINPHNGKTLKTTALIDTGADHCIIPAAYAELLGHDLKKGQLSQAKGFNDDIVEMYRHTMQIKINDFTTEEVMIAFNSNLRKPILGVKTFLSNFILTVNYPGQTFSLRTPDIQENMVDWGTP